MDRIFRALRSSLLSLAQPARSRAQLEHQLATERARAQALYDQAIAVGVELAAARRPHSNGDASDSVQMRQLAALVHENEALKAQLASIGSENVGLRSLYDEANRDAAEARHQAGLRDVQLRATNYQALRCYFQMKALQRELFGPGEPCTPPPTKIPADIEHLFTMSGKAELRYDAYVDWTYSRNHPAIYADFEIDAYTDMMRRNLEKPRNERDWYVYGTLDEWMCDAIAKYPVRGKSVVHMGSMTPWYESMSLLFGASSTTIDYNTIMLRTNRLRVMTIQEWDEQRPRFDVGFSISSFEHDGLGAYGDPIDPDGDLKAMRLMKERIVPNGLLFLAVPTGRDLIRWNMARVYGRHRLPRLMSGWEWIDSFGYSETDLDGDGSAQPLYILRNVPD